MKSTLIDQALDRLRPAATTLEAHVPNESRERKPATHLASFVRSEAIHSHAPLPGGHMDNDTISTYPNPGQRVLVTLNPFMTGDKHVEEERIFHDPDNWEPSDPDDIWLGRNTIASWRPV